MSALLASAPIGLVVLAMTVWRWGAASAGLLGSGATLVWSPSWCGPQETRRQGRVNGSTAHWPRFFSSCHAAVDICMSVRSLHFWENR